MADIIGRRLKDKTLKKGEKTYLRLLLGAIKTLDQISYAQLRVQDICEHADVSHGLFYHYFQDKADITRILVHEYITSFYRLAPVSPSTNDPYLKIFAANHYYVGCHRRNTGLVQILIANYEDLPNMLDTYNAAVFKWHSKIAKSMPDEYCGQSINENEKLLLAYMLGGMADEILRQINITKNKHLKTFQLKRNLFRISEFLSLIWYRAIYASDPPAESRANAFSIYGE